MDSTRLSGNTVGIRLGVNSVSHVKRVLGIVGSYREAGTIARVTAEVLAAARSTGAQTHLVHLSEYDINFCTNCRQCMQPPGEARIRNPRSPRKAVLISSSAAPGFMNRRLFGSNAVAALKRFSTVIGASVAKTIRVGQVTDPDVSVPDRILSQAHIIGTRLGR